MAITEPLDLQYWLVTTLSGGWEVFFFIAAITIAIVSAKFKMNGIVFGCVLFLFAIVMAPFANWIWIIAGFSAGIVIYSIIGRIVDR